MLDCFGLIKPVHKWLFGYLFTQGLFASMISSTIWQLIVHFRINEVGSAVRAWSHQQEGVLKLINDLITSKTSIFSVSTNGCCCLRRTSTWCSSASGQSEACWSTSRRGCSPTRTSSSSTASFRRSPSSRSSTASRPNSLARSLRSAQPPNT